METPNDLGPWIEKTQTKILDLVDKSVAELPEHYRALAARYVMASAVNNLEFSIAYGEVHHRAEVRDRFDEAKARILKP